MHALIEDVMLTIVCFFSRIEKISHRINEHIQSLGICKLSYEQMESQTQIGTILIPFSLQ